MTPKTVQKFTKDLTVLYVEDDKGIRESSTELFKQFFARVDVAEDGKEALELYETYYVEEHGFYDFIITDINMPNMNGIDMIKAINKRNMKQTIIVTSAHDDANYLISLIEMGVDSFILKPFQMDLLLSVFFKNAQKVVDRKFVMEHYTQMKIKYKHLKDAFKVLKEENLALNLQCKNSEEGHIISKDEAKAQVSEGIASGETVLVDDSAYFQTDDDDGEDNILLLDEHGSVLLELFDEISELIVNASKSPESSSIKVVEKLAEAASVFEFYSPYLDVLASSLHDLSDSIYRHMNAFIEILEEHFTSISELFDAVYRDMKMYVERFSQESMAMKNIHHIHEPTALSIQQIISIIAPEDVEAGEIDFF